jgi:hypothetical protein
MALNTRFDVIDPYMARGILLHLAKELRHEHRCPSGEHEPMRSEGLLADLERDVRYELGLEEAANMLEQV